MGIDNLTLKDIKELKCFLGGNSTVSHPPEVLPPHPYEVGKNYVIVTVTLYYMGKLEAVYKDELRMSSVSFLPEVERLHEFLGEGILKEVQPTHVSGDALIGRGGIISVFNWLHPLPSEPQ